MKAFNDSDFLLTNETAKKLFHGQAENLPIFDFHCHLPIEEIYEDRVYESITDLWLVDKKNGKAFGDHYKWRLMRAHGVSEEFITGDASKKEKFLAWADTVENAFLNPLYHWSHLELKKYFGIEECLTRDNAEDIYERMNAKLSGLSVRRLLEMSHVDTLYTTDDPLSDLSYHKLLKKDSSFHVHVLPAFRADDFLKAYHPDFPRKIQMLSAKVGYSIESMEDLKKALEERLCYFQENGCRAFDVSFEDFLYVPATKEETEEVFHKAMMGKKLTEREVGIYMADILLFLGEACKRHCFVMQLHIKALRNLNSHAFATLGCDSGYDAISDSSLIRPLSHFIDDLEKKDSLYKTIIYPLDSRDYETVLAMIGCFQKAPYPSKIQFGAAWWFNDHKEGMERQMRNLAEYGLLPHFVGMLTDSRSFLSYARHEYFRRILANLIGKAVEEGEYPNKEERLSKMVRDIGFENAVNFFTKD